MATALAHAFFLTAIGECAIAWNDVGIAAIWLPEADRAALQRRVRRRGPAGVEAEPPAGVAAAVASIRCLLAGEPVDLVGVAVDLAGVDDFDRRVYAVARTIRPGHVLSYGEVAARLGAPATAREVGQALGRNPLPIVVPCHRVVASGAGGAGLGGFSAPGGTATKRRLLAIEDARRDGPPGLFDGVAADDDASDDAAASGGEAGPRH